MLTCEQLQKGKIYECLSFTDPKPFFLVELSEKSVSVFSLKVLTENGIEIYFFFNNDKFKEIET
jgi:hypothetical protein